MRLGDEWVTLVKTTKWNISEKMTDTPYLFRRNRRDLLGSRGTSEIGYCNFRFVSPLLVHIRYIHIHCPLINTPTLRG